MEIEQVIDNIARMRANIDKIKAQCGYDYDITLIGVTKTKPAELSASIQNLSLLTDVGENYVQELVEKYPYAPNLNWHFVGQLQSNKVKYIIDKVCMIHSVDSLKLAEEIDKRAAQHGITMDILIQVNSAQEESKFGITTGETGQMIQDILANCPHVRIRGLMCIAPFEDNPEDAGQYFAAVKALYDEYAKMQHPNLDFKYLSMGMSNDFEVAIENGSNLIRVGTSIFGARDYSKK